MNAIYKKKNLEKYFFGGFSFFKQENRMKVMFKKQVNKSKKY